METQKERSPSQDVDVLYSSILIHLLRGPLYAGEKPELWNGLLERQNQVRDYLRAITLSLYLDEAEGYAFLRQVEVDSGEDEALPRLIRKRPLGMPMSVLCILLRKWLVEQDSKGGELRVVIERTQIHTELSLFLREEKSEAKRYQRIEQYIQQAIDWGLIREMKGDTQRIEILRITKALINAEWLGDLDQRLAQYRAACGLGEEGASDV